MRLLRFLVLLLVVFPACRRDEPPSIIVISIDTLRSDHLPAYGYTAIETPAIDGFRADSILYRQAWSQCPLTLVSHASIFTGLLPAEHGIRDNLGYTLNAKTKTIAEVLKARGYATGGAVSAVVLRGETGIRRGFDFWDDDIDIDPNFLSLGRAQRSGEATRAVAQRWIAAHSAKPFFFFFHIYEPHTPYEPTYDADVVTADAVVGRFLQFLRDERIYDRAEIVLLSDHGEGLGDHGEMEHGIFLYRETLQVPLMLKLPHSARRGESIDDPVELLDVFTTLTGENSEGRSLLASERDREIYSETYYPRFHFGWSELHSLISGTHHYIQAPKPELYDLGSDPGERRNALQDERRTYAEMRNAIASFVKRADAPKSIDPEQARQLAALGYVGSAVAEGGAALPDPKDHIGASSLMKDGFLAFQEKRYDEAVKIFDALLRDSPNMLDVWSMQANALARLGRDAEAIEAARHGLRLSPASAALAGLISTLALQNDRLDEAEIHAHLLEKEAPSEAHSLLAQVYIARKDFRRAAMEAEEVAGAQRDRPVGIMLLGRIAMEEGDPQDALREFDRALALTAEHDRRPVPRLNYFRGDVLARMGEAERAEAAFRKEIEAYPSDPQAYKNLMLLLVAQGKNDEATRLIFSLEQSAPIAPSYIAIADTLRVLGDVDGSRFWAGRGLKRYPTDVRLQALAKGG